MSEVASEHAVEAQAQRPGPPAAGPAPSAQPRRYRPPVSRLWWLRRTSYLLFVLRELSSVFVAWFVVYLLLFVRSVSRGHARYLEFVVWSRHPVVMVLNVATLLFVVFHAVTWFNLAPKAMVVHLRGKRLPPSLISASNYGAWVVATAFLLWLVLGG